MSQISRHLFSDTCDLQLSGDKQWTEGAYGGKNDKVHPIKAAAMYIQDWARY